MSQNGHSSIEPKRPTLDPMPRKPSKHETPDWRQFEKLVAEFERLLAHSGAVVTSPDMVLHVTTQKMREVDATIRWQMASVPVLVTIECRKRKHKQDVTWIEQLIAKKNGLGASATIAVSSAGFTAQAEMLATQNGILLRKLDQAVAPDALKWLGALNIRVREMQITVMKLLFTVTTPGGRPVRLPPDVESRLTQRDLSVPVLVDPASRKALSLGQLVGHALHTDPNINANIDRLTPDGPGELWFVVVKPDPTPVELITDSGTAPLRELAIGAQFRLVSKGLHLEIAHIYSDPKTVIAERAKYQLESTVFEKLELTVTALPPSDKLPETVANRPAS